MLRPSCVCKSPIYLLSVKGRSEKNYLYFPRLLTSQPKSHVQSRMTRRWPIYLEEFYNFKCTGSRDFLPPVLLILRKLTNTKDCKRMLLLQKMLAICGGLVISNTGRFRTVLASSAVEWHAAFSEAERCPGHSLKGQSNEIFQLRFFFITRTSLGHWPTV